MVNHNANRPNRPKRRQRPRTATRVFNLGTHVKVVNHYSRYYHQLGTVTGIKPSCVTVRLATGPHATKKRKFTARELIPLDNASENPHDRTEYDPTNH